MLVSETDVRTTNTRHLLLEYNNIAAHTSPCCVCSSNKLSGRTSVDSAADPRDLSRSKGRRTFAMPTLQKPQGNLAKQAVPEHETVSCSHSRPKQNNKETARLATYAVPELIDGWLTASHNRQPPETSQALFPTLYPQPLPPKYCWEARKQDGPPDI